MSRKVVEEMLMLVIVVVCFAVFASWLGNFTDSIFAFIGEGLKTLGVQP